MELYALNGLSLPLTTDAQKTALRWNDQAEYLKKTQLYPIPSAELDQKMQDAWTDMLQQ